MAVFAASMRGAGFPFLLLVLCGDFVRGEHMAVIVT